MISYVIILLKEGGKMIQYKCPKCKSNVSVVMLTCSPPKTVYTCRNAYCDYTCTKTEKTTNIIAPQKGE